MGITLARRAAASPAVSFTCWQDTNTTKCYFSLMTWCNEASTGLQMRVLYCLYFSLSLSLSISLSLSLSLSISLSLVHASKCERREKLRLKAEYTASHAEVLVTLWLGNDILRDTDSQLHLTRLTWATLTCDEIDVSWPIIHHCTATGLGSPEVYITHTQSISYPHTHSHTESCVSSVLIRLDEASGKAVGFEPSIMSAAARVHMAPGMWLFEP